MSEQRMLNNIVDTVKAKTRGELNDESVCEAMRAESLAAYLHVLVDVNEGVF